MPSLSALARAAGLSQFHFHRLFKAHTGLTPKAYAQADRQKRLREGLATSDTVTSALDRADSIRTAGSTRHHRSSSLE